MAGPDDGEVGRYKQTVNYTRQPLNKLAKLQQFLKVCTEKRSSSSSSPNFANLRNFLIGDDWGVDGRGGSGGGVGKGGGCGGRRGDCLGRGGDGATKICEGNGRNGGVGLSGSDTGGGGVGE